MKKILAFASLLVLTGSSCSFLSAPEKFACAYNGIRYEVGAQFASEDSCNTCTCGENGQIACTQKACGDTVQGQTCQIAADCEASGIDISFCAQGSWACVNSLCEYACDSFAL